MHLFLKGRNLLLSSMLFLCFLLQQSNAFFAFIRGAARESVVRDLKFEIPSSVRGQKDVHIRILLQNKEVFRGSLDDVKAGDINFTVPEAATAGGDGSMIVDFFIPPSEMSIGQSFLLVEVDSDDSIAPVVSSKRLVAAVSSSAFLGIGLGSLLRRSSSPQIEVPPPQKIEIRPMQAFPQAEMRDDLHLSPKENPTPRFVFPHIPPPGYVSKLKRDSAAIMSRLQQVKDIINEHRVPAAAVGAVVAVQAASSLLKFATKPPPPKFKTSPVITIMDRNTVKVRDVLAKSVKMIRKILDKP